MGICYIRNHNVSECAALKIKYGRKNMNLFENATNEEVNHPGLRLDALEAGACKSSN